MLANQEGDLAVWIRPERVGFGYTVEWMRWTTDHDAALQLADAARDSEPAAAVRDWARQLLNDHTPNVRSWMPSFDVDREQINAFVIDDTYLFKHFFDRDEVFDALRPYYNESAYRFEVPAEEFSEVQDRLDDQFVDLTVVDDPDRFCVVKRRYTDHPDVLFKASVLQRERQDYTVFLMKDQLSVEQAVNTGATRLAESDVSVDL